MDEAIILIIDVAIPEEIACRGKHEDAKILDNLTCDD